jgi:plastocyanin
VIWAVRAAFVLTIGVLLLMAGQAYLRPAASISSKAGPDAGDASPTAVSAGPPPAEVPRPTPTPPAMVSKMARATPTSLPPPTISTGDAPRIAITDAGFAPAELRVVVGRPVTWRNEGLQGHDVSAAGGQPVGWGSGPIGPAGTFQRLFGEPGRYDYICTLHPVMRGRIVVDP